MFFSKESVERKRESTAISPLVDHFSFTFAQYVFSEKKNETDFNQYIMYSPSCDRYCEDGEKFADAANSNLSLLLEMIFLNILIFIGLYFKKLD